MNMGVLRCQTVQGVLKELAVFTAVYNLTRAVMLESARRQRVRPTRLSFADAPAWLCHAEPDHGRPALKVVPERPGRAGPGRAAGGQAPAQAVRPDEQAEQAARRNA